MKQQTNDMYSVVCPNTLGEGRRTGVFMTVTDLRVLICANAVRKYGLKRGDRFRFLVDGNGRDWMLERTDDADAFTATAHNSYGTLMIGKTKLATYLTKAFGSPATPFRIPLGDDDGERITMVTAKYIKR